MFGADSAWQPTATPTAARPTTGNRILWRVLFAIYVLLVAACIVTFAFNPPWEKGRYAGVLALGASLVAGLPWSIGGLFAIGWSSHSLSSASLAEPMMYAISWLGAAINLWLLGGGSGFWRIRFWK